MDAISMKPNSANEHNRFGSSQVGQSLGLRKRGWELWTGFVLQQYKADEVIDIRTVKALFAIYFIIIGVGLTDWQGFDQKIVGQSLMQDNQMLAVRAVLFGLSLCVCVVHLAAFLSRQPLNAPPNLWTRISSIAKHLQWYIVMPLSLVLFRLDLFATKLKSCQDCTPATSGEQIFSWLLILLNLGLCILNVALKCELPTRGKLNSPSRLVQPAHYTVLMLLMLIGQNLRESTTGSVFQIASKIIGFSMIVVCWRLQVFWWYEVNRWYVLGHLGIFSLRNCIALVVSVNKDYGIVQTGFLVFLFVSFILKVGNNICIYRLRLSSSWAGKNVKNFENFVAFFTTELCNEAVELSCGDSELTPAMLFELSQIGRTSFAEQGPKSVQNSGPRDYNTIFSSRFTPRPNQLDTIGLISTRREPTGVDVTSAAPTENKPSSETEEYDPLEEYFRVLIKAKPTKPEELYYLLLLQLIFLRKNLLAISGTLSRYRKSLGSWADYSLNLFLIETMLRSRLETISTEDMTNDDTSLSPQQIARLSFNSKSDSGSQERQTLSAVFAGVSISRRNREIDDLTHIAEGVTKTGLRDIELGKILDCKHEYLTIISGINWFLDVKSDIFSMLFETYAHKSHFLYRRNALARKLTTQIDKAILKLMSWPRVPNYVFSAGMAYYLKIKFDLQKSEKIFKIYKANIFKYQTIANIHTKEINESNFMYNSVIMKLSISQDSSLGSITDITPNYKEHLGDPVSQDPIKQNVNVLFPGKMMEVHTKMMRGSIDQSMFNVQKDFQMNGFDSRLRPLRYLLKLDTSVADGLHVIALLKFQTSKHKHLLLIDEKMEIVSAEAGFWEVTEALQTTANLSNLWMLSETLAAQIYLMKYLKLVLKQTGDQSEELTDQQPGNANLAKQISSSSAQNIELAKNIQASGLQKFGQQAYELMKQQVSDALFAYEGMGILHIVNEELGVPGLPIYTKVEFTTFGDEEYYRVWLSFDLGFNRETRSLRTTQRQQDDIKSKLPSSFIENTGEKQAPKMSDSDSRDHDKPQYNDSLQSDGYKGDNSIHQEFRSTKLSFEQVLQRMKTESPIAALLNEALNKDYPEDIKNALSWVKQYLKTLEATEPGLKADYKLSTVIRHMTQRRFVSDVSQNATAQFDRGNTASDLQVPLHESPVIYMQKDAPAPRLIRDLSREPSYLKEASKQDGGTLGVDPKIKSHQLTTHTSPFQSHNDLDIQGSSRSDTGRQAKTATSTVHKKTLSLSKAPPKKGSTGTSPMSKPQKVQFKERNSKTVGPANDKHLRVKVMSLAASNPDQRESAVREPNIFKMGKAEIPSNVTIKSSNEDKKTVKEYNPIEEAQEKLEASGSDHHTAKTSIFSQLAKKLFRFRSVRQATNDNSRAHSDKKRNELNPLAISAMAKADAFISQNEANAKIIGKYIGDFKAIQRADMNPDDKNNSITGSQSSNASRGSYYIKVVTNTVASQKRGIFVYWFTAVLLLFSIYYLAIFQYLAGTMTTYNLSTLNNFNLMDNFITLDRKITQACEVQDYLSGLSSGLFNKADYMYGIASFARLVPPTTNGSAFLMGQLSDLTNDLYLSMAGIMKSSLEIDSDDLENVNAATFNDEKLTHWGNLTTPGVYEEWTMPYFTVLMYYNNLYRKNLAVLRELSLLAWTTNYTFKMSPSLSARYQQTITTKIAMDKRIYDQVMVAKDKQFDGIIDNVVNLSVARYFMSVFTILYISLAVFAVMVGYMIYMMYQINFIQSDYLENYNLLRPWELFVIIEEIEKLAVLFTKFAFNEIQMMGQYLDFSLYSRTGMLGNRLNRLEHHFSREKEKQAGGFKFDHDFRFFSSKFGWVLLLLTGVLFALIFITVEVFRSVDQRRQGIVKLYFDSHRGLLQVTKYYLMSPLIAIYGYAIPVSGEPISKSAYSTAIDNFLVLHTLAKANYSYLLGAEGQTIEKVNFGTICDFLLTDTYLKGRFGGLYKMCNMNDGSTSKGLVGFLQYEKFFVQNVITRFQTNYSDWLEQSRTVTPREPQFRELFEPRFLELRVGHRLMFNIYYYLMSKIIVNLVTSIKSQLDYFVVSVMQSIVAAVYILLAVTFVWMLRIQARELDVCYETFKLIDPYFLVNNRYLQFRFKAAFKGVE